MESTSSIYWRYGLQERHLIRDLTQFKPLTFQPFEAGDSSAHMQQSAQRQFSVLARVAVFEDSHSRMLQRFLLEIPGGHVRCFSSRTRFHRVMLSPGTRSSAVGERCIYITKPRCLHTFYATFQTLNCSPN